MISRSAEYALRIVICLAHRVEPLVSSEELAHRTGVSLSYQAKILQCLRRAGIVHAIRGRCGGVQLARAADSLLVRDVIEAVPHRRNEGLGGSLLASLSGLGILNSRVREVLDRTEWAFGSTTIGDLCREEGSRPCGGLEGPGP